mgnify:CR=1 FL=1
MESILPFFKNNKKDLKKITKRINMLLSDSTFLSKLISNNNFSYDISQIIKYYILSGEKRVDYSYEELIEIINKFNQEELNLTDYEDNIILANASNGYLKHHIEKRGFKGINFDPILTNELEYVEEKLNVGSGHNKFQNELNDNDYIYFTTPGSLVVDYAMKISPERLYLGILNGIETMPYILGEGKISYCKRYLNKILQEKELENDNILKNYIDDILNKLCKDDPIISLFPSKTRKGSLDVYTAHIGNGEKKKVEDYIQSSSDYFVDGYADFSIGGSVGGTNAGDLVTDDINKISKSDIGIINIPDWFKCLEIYAHQNGYVNGDEIDINSFKKIELNFNQIEQENMQTQEIESFITYKNHKSDKNSILADEMINKMVEGTLDVNGNPINSNTLDFDNRKKGFTGIQLLTVTSFIASFIISLIGIIFIFITK